MINEQALSRVFSLRPMIREHVQITPQHYRGETWYVLFDKSAAKYMRFDARVYQVIGRLDGELTLDEIFHQVNSHKTFEPFSREELIELIGQLDAAELLSGGLPVDVDGSFKRYQEQQVQARQRSLMNPLAIRVKLLDPEKILTALSPIGNQIFSQAGLVIWALLLLLALLIGVAYSERFFSQVADLSFSPLQIALIWVIYPLIKLLHELGHGLAIKKWGGSVNEAGVNFLIFLPVPYVDATASWAFRSKWKRITVGAAGIMTELLIAAIAMLLWVLIEPGLVQEILLNIIIIATVSTLLFNGNPLLKFDGYFVLEDWLEIPNLATRSKQYYFYLIQRYLLRLDSKPSPVTAYGERFWFLLYGFASPLYRIFIMFAVALYLASYYLFVGVLLAGWTLLMQVLSPLFKGLVYLFTDAELQQQRWRGFALFTTIGLLVVFVLAIPLPLVTSTQGVVTVQTDSRLVAPANGFIEKVYAQAGDQVEKGQLLMQLRDDDLQQKIIAKQQQRKQLLIELNQLRERNRVERNNRLDDLRTLEIELEQLNDKLAKTKIYSPHSGSLILEQPDFDLHNQYVSKGQAIGQVVDAENLVVKAYVKQERIGLLKTQSPEIELVPASNLKLRMQSKIINETPKAQAVMPYAALSTVGGGELLLQPNQAEMQLKNPVFLVDIALPKQDFNPVVGERVYVRLDHGSASVAYQLSLQLHQLFLKYLGDDEV